MKKFLFVINNMHIGGTRSSLLNLLRLLPHEDIEISLYLLSDHGEYINMIDNRVKIIKTSWVSNSIYAKPNEVSFLQKVFRGIIRILRKLLGEEKTLTWINKRIAAKILPSQYDVAIAYSEGEPVNVVSEVCAKRRYAWIHNDYSNLTGVKAGFIPALDKMKEIFFVAEAARLDFAKAFPNYEKKLRIIRNTINVEDIEKKSNQIIKDLVVNNEIINIISVGRMSKQKAFDRIPVIVSKLKSKKIHWYLIGDGDQRNIIQEAINKYRVESQITILGVKSNPYPYIKKADILVVTSLYESQPMVILEALLLKTPVISTNFTSAKELLYGKKYGLLCQNSVDGIINTLSHCLDKSMLLEMKRSCNDFRYDNSLIIRKVLEL